MALQGLNGSFQLGQSLFQGAPGAGQDDALVLCPGFAEDVSGVQPELGLVEDAMAEKYGVPEVVFETESGIPLPTLEEMEETFKNFGLIKASLTAQLEVIDSTSHSMVFKTKKIPFKRLSSISESMKTEREITYGTLIWNISWQQSVYNGSYQCPVVSATGTIEFSPEMQRLGYFTSNNRNFCSIRGTELYITFECQINYSRSHFNFAYSDWVHPGFRPYR